MSQDQALIYPILLEYIIHVIYLVSSGFSRSIPHYATDLKERGKRGNISSPMPLIHASIQKLGPTSCMNKYGKHPCHPTYTMKRPA